MRIGFIGAGKVGCTLGKYFVTHGAKAAGYYSRRTDSAQEAAAFTQSNVYENIADLVKDSDVLFLTVPDSEITKTYQAVIQNPVQNKWICHCSGALASDDAFPAIKQTGAFGFSVHPLFAVSDKYHAYEELTDVFFAVDGGQGDEKALAALLAWLKKLGLSPVAINAAEKAKYHCAAACASNLAIGLLSLCTDLMQQAGFADERAALVALKPLVLGNLEHVFADGLAASLTGPVERGDAATVEKHLACFDVANDAMLYRLLSEKVLDIAKIKHPKRSYQSLEKLLMLGESGKDHERKESNG